MEGGRHKSPAMEIFNAVRTFPRPTYPEYVAPAVFHSRPVT